jgi:hypothetical protein
VGLPSLERSALKKYAIGFIAALVLIGGVGTVFSVWSVYSAPDEDFWKFDRKTVLSWNLVAMFVFTVGYLFGYTIWYSLVGHRASDRVSTVLFAIAEVAAIGIAYLVVIFTPAAEAVAAIGLGSDSILFSVFILAFGGASFVGLIRFVIVAALNATGRTRC